MAFISPKKIGTAVQRNRAKRLLKEAYRIHQHLVKDLVNNNSALTLHGAFIARKAGLPFTVVEQDVITLLNHLRTRVAAFTPS